MTIQNPSYFRILPVWLVLLAFLCCMMVPSLAHAKKEMTIATEGDPTDGLGASGGGSGLISDQETIPLKGLESEENLWFEFSFTIEINENGSVQILWLIEEIYSGHFSQNYPRKFGVRRGANN